MNLLILGAGGHGRVVRETAEVTSLFQTISFLDDHKSDAIGRFDDYKAFRDRFDSAFVAIGDNEIRELWQSRLEAVGYSIPTLIHPRAYISPSAVIGVGTIVEPLDCVNTGSTIGSGCIISISAVVDHDCETASFSHIDCGVILPPRSYVGQYGKVTINTTLKAEYYPRINPTDAT